VTHPNESGGAEFRSRPSPRHRPPRDARAAALLEAYERHTESRRALSVESDRARFWYAVRIALTCVLGCVTGFVPMAWALHTTNMEAAVVAWSVGPVLGSSIVLVTLVVGYFRWTRDEW
jgi:hypothetical protein